MNPTNYRVEETPYGRDLVVTGAWGSESARAIYEGTADGLTLNYALGYKEPNLEFISDLPIRRLKILARTIEDAKPLYSLTSTLTSLSLTAGSGLTLEAGRLPLLTSLSTEWHHVANSLKEATNLQSLYLGGYAGRDLVPLESLNRLNSLRMKDRPKVESLHGLENLTRLETLNIESARNLSDFSALALETARIRLKHIDFDSDKRIHSLESFESLTGLESLGLGNCGEIDSLWPIAGLSAIKRLFLHESTRIMDNDLRPLELMPRLELLGLMSRKEYVPSVIEIEAAIGRRQSTSSQ